MIHIRCQRRRGGHRLEITGHAEHGPAGQDIVCAGVSAISWALLGYLDGRGLLEDAWADKGAMGLDIREDERARAALELAMTGYQQLREKYPQNVEVSMEPKDGGTAGGVGAEVLIRPRTESLSQLR